MDSTTHAGSVDFYNTLEVMAPYLVRALFKVQDGDPVWVEIEDDDEWWNANDEID